jgi:NAD(P)H dehydrogenase (quinone)
MGADLIAVTGATGGVGGRVASLLTRKGLQQRLLARDPDRLPNLPGAHAAQFGGYDDPSGMERALEGAATLFLVSAAEEQDRVRLHRNAVDAAVAAGVERIVYTSFFGAGPATTFTFARDHFHPEEHIRASGVRHTFLRSTIYLDFLPLMCGPDFVIRGPAGDGRFSPVALDDVAEVAAAVLTSDGHDGETYEITGPELMSMSDVAAVISRVTGRRVVYEEETLEEARESRKATEAPDWAIEGWVTSYLAIATGELERVTDVVERLTGHEPRRLEDWLRENPQTVRHLTSTA